MFPSRESATSSLVHFEASRILFFCGMVAPHSEDSEDRDAIHHCPEQLDFTETRSVGDWNYVTRHTRHRPPVKRTWSVGLPHCSRRLNFFFRQALMIFVIWWLLLAKLWCHGIHYYCIMRFSVFVWGFSFIHCERTRAFESRENWHGFWKYH